MAQPYDFSTQPALRAAIEQMIADQTAGKVKFAGGATTWVPSPTGAFNAIQSSGGAPAPTTTNLVRIALRGIRATLDILASGTGAAAANVIQADTPPTLLLETGRLTTGPTYALGPLVNPPGSVAQTTYDLSGIPTLQTTVNAMLADQQSGATVFVGNSSFQAILVPGVPAQAIDIGAARGRFVELQRRFDLLDQ